MKRYTTKMVQWLSKNVPGKSFSNITILFNEKFETDFTTMAIKTACHNRGIKNGKKFPFSEAQREYIRENYAVMTYKDITYALNKKYRSSFTISQIKTYCAKIGISKNHSPVTREVIHFIRQIMPIQAVKAAELVNAKFGTSYTSKSIRQFTFQYRIKNGSFNSSETCGMKKPIYSEHIITSSANGKQYIHIKFQNKEGYKYNWKKKHIWVWEQAYGPVPDGHTIVFLDNNTLNCSIENLCLVSDQIYMNMYFHKLFSNNPEVTKAGIVVAMHRAVINEKIKAVREDRKRYNNGF